jgi:hypothetical protein
MLRLSVILVLLSMVLGNALSGYLHSFSCELAGLHLRIDSAPIVN